MLAAVQRARGLTRSELQPGEVSREACLALHGGVDLDPLGECRVCCFGVLLGLPLAHRDRSVVFEWIRNFPVHVLTRWVGYGARTIFESLTCHHVHHDGP